VLVPEGFPKDMWRDLETPERFYVRMLAMEAKGSTKVADFQNFAKSFAFAAYADLMASTAANAAALAGAADLKGRMLDGEGFAERADKRRSQRTNWTYLAAGKLRLFCFIGVC
jgi:putative DNA methylase